MSDIRNHVDHTSDDPASFLAYLQSIIQPLAQQYAELSWQLNLTGRDDIAEQSAAVGEQLASVFADPVLYKLVSDIHHSDINDPLIARQYDLLYNEFKTGQISAEAIKRITQLETDLGQIYNNFRAELDGRPCSDNELAAVLEHNTDSAYCIRAWEASKQIGPLVAPKLLELIKLRNSEAQRLGYSDYYSMSVELQELDPVWLAETLQQLDELTRAPFLAYKNQLDTNLAAKFGISTAELHPAHYGDPFFQSAPAGITAAEAAFYDIDIEAICTQFYHDIGMDVSGIISRSDLYEREGKCQHAFCINIDRGQDIRVLCNLRNTERWLSTMLHELGHAVYDQYIPSELPYFLREPAHTLSTEAIAELMGRFSKNPTWLRKYSGISEEVIEQVGGVLRDQLRNELLVFTRWVLVMCEFERQLYADPDGELNKLWWQIVGKYQMISAPRADSAADWAAKIHFSIAPAYYQNYILGEMMASQLLAALKAKGLDEGQIASSEATGRLLIDDVFRYGKSVHWNTLMEHATGEPLTPRYFAADLSSESR